MADTDTYPAQGTRTAGQGEYLSTGEAAALLGVSPSTVQRWDREGLLQSHRTLSNQRRFLRHEVLAAIPRPL